MILKNFRAEDYRCFKDTGQLELSRFNVFVGPNNAGKSSIVQAIELLLRSREGGPRSPLAISEQAAFASFQSVRRKHWSRHEPQATDFRLEADWVRGLSRRFQAESEQVKTRFTCTEDKADGGTIIDSVDLSFVTEKERRNITAKRTRASTYELRTNDLPKSARPQEALFDGMIPHVFRRYPEQEEESVSSRYWDVASRHLWRLRRRSRGNLVVLRPFRSAPRSVYVIDDPSLSQPERNLVSHLLSLWTKQDESTVSQREQIVQDLSRLGLASHFEVAQPRKLQTRVAEMRVATQGKRQTVSIADVGFGVSQVLPLIVYNAGLHSGDLVAYQPEVHLHPRAQARLADILAESVTRRKNRIFVETHSIDFLLRLQLLIAEGHLKPEFLRIFCVERSSSCSTVSPLTFNNEGVPSRKWPTGFVDTSLSTSRDLMKARANARQRKMSNNAGRKDD